MKVGRKTNRYKRIKKLLDNGGEDRELGKELLWANLDQLHPDEFFYLNEVYPWSSSMKHISVNDLQKYLYDKRQEEIRANKRGDSQEDQ